MMTKTMYIGGSVIKIILTDNSIHKLKQGDIVELTDKEFQDLSIGGTFKKVVEENTNIKHEFGNTKSKKRGKKT